jgi:hypothetical protein
MEEILYELKDHSLGLNCSIWDYAASIICKFGLYKIYDSDSGSIKDLLRSPWEASQEGIYPMELVQYISAMLSIL